MNVRASREEELTALRIWRSELNRRERAIDRVLFDVVDHPKVMDEVMDDLADRARILTEERSHWVRCAEGSWLTDFFRYLSKRGI